MNILKVAVVGFAFCVPIAEAEAQKTDMDMLAESSRILKVVGIAQACGVLFSNHEFVTVNNRIKAMRKCINNLVGQE